MSGKHSILPPSSAGEWVNCSGWVTLNASYPEQPETDDSRDGDAVHELAAIMIDSRSRANTPPVPKIGDTMSNGVVLTGEMFECATVYADDVEQVMRFHASYNPQIEKTLPIPSVWAQQFGTPDCWLWCSKSATLYLWDYKNGHGTVEAFENWQAIDYLAGIRDHKGWTGRQDEHINVVVRIVQPRSYHREGPIVEWKFKLADIRGHINKLKSAADESFSRNAKCKTGPHCRHCYPRFACEAALNQGMTLFESVSKPLPQPLSIAATGLQLSLIKRAKAQLEYLESSFEQQVELAIRSGQSVPGWTTEQKQGRQKWNRPGEEIIAMGKALKIDLDKHEPITPKQAIKKGVDSTTVDALSIIPNNGVAVVPESTTKAKKVFSK